MLTSLVVLGGCAACFLLWKWWDDAETKRILERKRLGEAEEERARQERMKSPVPILLPFNEPEAWKPRGPRKGYLPQMPPIGVIQDGVSLASGQIWFTLVKYEDDDEYKDRPVLLLERHPRNVSWWRGLMFTSQDKSGRVGYIKSNATIDGERKSWLKTDRVLNIHTPELRRFSGLADLDTWEAAQGAWQRYLLDDPTHSWMYPGSDPQYSASGRASALHYEIGQQHIDALLPLTMKAVRETQSPAVLSLRESDPDFLLRALARRFKDPHGVAAELGKLRLEAQHPVPPIDGLR